MSTAKDMDRLLNRFVEEGLSGCGVKVVQHGRTLYEGYAGFADIENQIPINEASVFRMASMSKIPLYTLCMMLYERGCFNLTDPLYEYLPDWKDLKRFEIHENGYYDIVPCKKQMTVSDILSMKCGLPYCNSQAPTRDLTLASMQECMKPLWEKGYYTNKEHVHAMSKAVLAFEPGEHWIYGFSSELACALAEVITGKGIDEAMEEMLFDPLDMKDTRSRFFGDIPDRLVKMYFRRPDGSRYLDHFPFDDKHLPDPEHEAGWARLFSTVEDYSHLMSMLAEGGTYKGCKIMSSRTIDMMRTDGLTKLQRKDFYNPYEAGYGYGYGVRTLVDPQAANHNASVGSFGWTGGFGTWCEADPNEGLSVVYMHNQVPDMNFEFHHRIRVCANGLAE